MCCFWIYKLHNVNNSDTNENILEARKLVWANSEWIGWTFAPEWLKHQYLIFARIPWEKLDILPLLIRTLNQR